MLADLIDRLLKREDVADPEQHQHDLALAAATLLIEVAWADHNISEQELTVVREMLVSQFGLTTQEIEDIVSESRRQHDESVGLFRFTRALTEAWDEPERFELVVQMWRLAMADNQIDRFEEHMIRKISELLYVSHPRFIEAKRTVREEN